MFPIKSLRPWPVFLLLFIIFLSAANIITKKSRKQIRLLSDGAGSSSALLEKHGFTHFTTSLSSDKNGNEHKENNNVFFITPDLQALTIHCCASFQKIKREDFRLFLAWYKGGTKVFTDTVWLNRDDTLLRSSCYIPRGDIGHWSIDLTHKNNILLQTVSFEVKRSR